MPLGFIERSPHGLVVPIPTLFVEKSYTNPLVSIASPPAKVEVADALDATKFAAVMVEVAVMPDTEVMFPEISAFPCTLKVVAGEVVPIPTLPPAVILILSDGAVSVITSLVPKIKSPLVAPPMLIS